MCFSIEDTGVFFSLISPLSNFSNPAISLNKVVLPHPLEPRMEIISPLDTDIERLFTATVD